MKSYITDKCSLYNGDCVQLIKQLPDDDDARTVREGIKNVLIEDEERRFQSNEKAD